MDHGKCVVRMTINEKFLFSLTLVVINFLGVGVGDIV